MSCVKKIRGINNSHCKHSGSSLKLMVLIVAETSEEMEGGGYAN
jgi:hypothetical protein